MDLLFEIHEDMPRKGPGSNEATQKAFCILENFPKFPYILDIGCGSGMQTIQIAKLTDGKIIALDIYRPFLKELKNQARKYEVSDKIEIFNGSMSSLNFRESSFDLIWSEGAIFIIGFEKGLNEWKLYLKKGGYLVISELSWFGLDLPEEIRKFFEIEYPSINTIEQNVVIIKKLGYKLINYFKLAESAWWDNYYIPLEGKILSFRKKYKNNPDINKLLDTYNYEIDLYKKYSKFYGYVFYILKNT